MWTGIGTANLSHMLDCESYFILELQLYAKVMDYTPISSLRFLNICMLGKQLYAAAISIRPDLVNGGYVCSDPNHTLDMC